MSISEKKLHHMVLNDIRTCEFCKKIDKTADFLKKKTVSTGSGFIFDSMRLDIYQESVLNILDLLQGDLEVINLKDGKIKSIAMDSGKLYPDILAMGNESSRYYIIELKGNKKTEREALTELYAYEAEIMNHLPMLAKDSIVKIIIATDYYPTLCHAVTNSIFRGDLILCLKPEFHEGEIHRYIIEDVLEWTKVDYEPLTTDNRNIFEGVSICFYKNPSYSDDISEKEVIQDMKFASEFLGNIEGGNRGNGFCIVWKRNASNNHIYDTITDFGITVFVINPYLLSIRDIFQRDDVLSEFIYANYYDRDWGETGNQLLNTSWEILRRTFGSKYSLMLETYSNFLAYEDMLKHIEKIKTWGVFGRQLQSEYFRRKDDWFEGMRFDDVNIIYKLIVLLFEDYPFRTQIGAGESFQLGIYIKGIEEICGYGHRLNRMQLYYISRLWNYVFCARCSLFPDKKGEDFLKVSNKTIPKILLFIQEIEETVAGFGEKHCEAIKKGKRFAAFSWEMRYFPLCKIYDADDLSELLSDDIGGCGRDHLAPVSLRNYFMKEYNRVSASCSENETTVDFVIDDTEINIEEMASEYMMELLRKMLNY